MLNLTKAAPTENKNTSNIEKEQKSMLAKKDLPLESATETAKITVKAEPPVKQTMITETDIKYDKKVTCIKEPNKENIFVKGNSSQITPPKANKITDQKQHEPKLEPINKHLKEQAVKSNEPMMHDAKKVDRDKSKINILQDILKFKTMLEIHEQKQISLQETVGILIDKYNNATKKTESVRALIAQLKTDTQNQYHVFNDLVMQTEKTFEILLEENTKGLKHDFEKTQTTFKEKSKASFGEFKSSLEDLSSKLQNFKHEHDKAVKDAEGTKFAQEQVQILVNGLTAKLHSLQAVGEQLKSVEEEIRNNQALLQVSVTDIKVNMNKLEKAYNESKKQAEEIQNHFQELLEY